MASRRQEVTDSSTPFLQIRPPLMQRSEQAKDKDVPNPFHFDYIPPSFRPSFPFPLFPPNPGRIKKLKGSPREIVQNRGRQEVCGRLHRAADI